MSEVRWLGPALRDLEEIKAFYDDKEKGDRLTREILDVERLLSEFPNMGRVSKNVTPEHRELVRAAHLIVYRVDPDAVKILAVIDCPRNFSAAWLSKKR